MSARRAAAGLAVVGALALSAGCTGSDPDPTTSTSTSTSGSSTTSPSSSTPTTSSTSTTTSASGLPADLPEAARKHNREGAIAMAKYFTLALDDAFVTNDNSKVAELSDKDCFACQGVIRSVKKNAGDGVHQTAGALTIDGVLPKQPTSSESPLENVDLLITDKGSTFVNKAGKVVHKNPSKRLTNRVQLKWNDGRWTVTATGQLQL